MQTPTPLFPPNAKILFQGDSITDGNRGRNADPNHILGHGYAFIIAALQGARFPQHQFTFINRGISGHKIPDLDARWQADTLDLAPDYLSILIGINDLFSPVTAEQYHAQYDALLARTRAALPNVRFILGEPFAYPPPNTETDVCWSKLPALQQAVAALAKKYGAPLVRYQQAFDAARRLAPAEYWIWDTIHPTYAGHQIMADEWIKTVAAG